MDIVRTLAVLALALAPVIAAAGGSAIPHRFLGEWNPDVSQCGKGTDESLLYIEPRRVRFWESSGPVRAAVARGRELALILELSGEGEVWLSATQFDLSRDGNELVWETTSGEKFVRFRCPSAKERPNNSSKPTPLRGAA
ncbi:hypothetical protein GCM10007067_13680 [Lysobacter bugurensis]|uniref:C-type lysozyme inhibitor domain-containing protein n=1 Tax=Cognatilysobacter bugurensis TaxID=543356 RepID=A0A918SYQ6_9GAMM|nr:hypothetical protein GCM10007067_13680 [Lysobacter bugurensis]